MHEDSHKISEFQVRIVGWDLPPNQNGYGCFFFGGAAAGAARSDGTDAGNSEGLDIV